MRPAEGDLRASGVLASPLLPAGLAVTSSLPQAGFRPSPPAPPDERSGFESSSSQE